MPMPNSTINILKNMTLCLCLVIAIVLSFQRLSFPLVYVHQTPSVAGLINSKRSYQSIDPWHGNTFPKSNYMRPPFSPTHTMPSVGNNGAVLAKGASSNASKGYFTSLVTDEKGVAVSTADEGAIR